MDGQLTQTSEQSLMPSQLYLYTPLIKASGKGLNDSPHIKGMHIWSMQFPSADYNL